MSNSVIRNIYLNRSTRFTDHSFSVHSYPKAFIHSTNENYHPFVDTPCYINDELNKSNNNYSGISSFYRSKNDELNSYNSNLLQHNLLLHPKLVTIEDKERKETFILNDFSEDMNNLKETIKIKKENFEDTLNYLTRLSKKEIGPPKIFYQQNDYKDNQEKPGYIISDDNSIQPLNFYKFNRNMKPISEYTKKIFQF